MTRPRSHSWRAGQPGLCSSEACTRPPSELSHIWALAAWQLLTELGQPSQGKVTGPPGPQKGEIREPHATLLGKSERKENEVSWQRKDQSSESRDTEYSVQSRLQGRPGRPGSPTAPGTCPRELKTQHRHRVGLGLGSAWCCHQVPPTWSKSSPLPGFWRGEYGIRQWANKEKSPGAASAYWLGAGWGE